MSILEKFDTDVNFWEVNPQLKLVDEFSELYKNDKSKNKVDSSRTMWAIALLLDKSKNNQFRNLPFEEAKDQLAKHFLKDETFEWGNPWVQRLMEQYEKLILTQAMRSLRNWESKMKERDDFINSISYDIEIAEKIDKMLTNYPKMFDTYKIISEALQLDEETDDKSKRKFTTEI